MAPRGADAADPTCRRPAGDRLRVDPEQAGDLTRRQQPLSCLHVLPLGCAVRKVCTRRKPPASAVSHKTTGVSPRWAILRDGATGATTGGLVIRSHGPRR